MFAPFESMSIKLLLSRLPILLGTSFTDWAVVLLVL